MSFRFLWPLFFCLLGWSSVQAEPVKAPHIQVELVSELQTIRPGQVFWVGIHQKLEKHWHTYWTNSGDSGIPPKMKWKLPKGFKVSPIIWPTPKKIRVGPLANYGYEDEVLLLMEVTAPKKLSGPTVLLSGEFRWLVCEEECIPGKALLKRAFQVSPTASRLDKKWAPAFLQAKKRLPLKEHALKATWKEGPKHITFAISGIQKKLQNQGITFYLFPDTKEVLAHSPKQSIQWKQNQLLVKVQKHSYFKKPKLFRSLLVAYKGSGKKSKVLSAYHLEVNPTASAVVKKGSKDTALPGSSGSSELSFWMALLFAFLGGVLLNLMPCVFPILSIKIIHFVEMSHEDPSTSKRHGLFYTLGVLASFLTLAISLQVLQAGGKQLGWGFQLQSPVFILLLLYMMFLMGLSLSGWFTLQASWLGMGDSLASKSGDVGSFFTGVLATVVATPCTAPLMAPALGFALGQPFLLNVLIFSSLGFGMAFPYLLLSFYPALQRFMPKPGKWMETFKELMAFPLYATGLWLLWVLEMQVGSKGLFVALGGLFGTVFAIWILKIDSKKEGLRRFLMAFGLLVLLGSVGWSVQGIQSAQPVQASTSKGKSGFGNLEKPFTPKRLQELLKANKPVFLNFTAAWCITCKVNERLVIRTQAIEELFKKRKIHYLVGDWTNSDPNITKMLHRFKRNGVPLYIYFRGKGAKAQVFPQILTQKILLSALSKE